MEQTAIKPIINGSHNPRLTHDQFKELDRSTKIQFLWSVLVNMEFAQGFPDIEPKVFEKPEKKYTYQDLQVVDADLDELFNVIMSDFQAHRNKMLNKSNQLRYDLGYKFWGYQADCGMGGMVETDAYRAKGYIAAIGNWNDFNHAKVGVAINRVEAQCPRQDYGVNNPNTGRNIHKWKVTHSGDYVILSYDFVDVNTKEEIEKFFPIWQSLGKGANADSCRIEVEEQGMGFFSVELYWWWD
jgi:hypothetical protein